MFRSLGSLLNSFRIPFRRRSVQSVFSRRGRRRSFVPSLGSHSALGVSLHDTLSHEPLEQRRLLAADVSLDGTILTVAFDDAGTDSVSISMNATGYQTIGSNVSSGTGTITELVVTDAGTAFPACVSILDASQQLTGGLSVGPNVDDVDISAPIDTAGGDVAIDSSQLTLSANINSGSGSQTYGADTSISLLNDLNLTTSTGVAGDIGIHIQGTVDSYYSADPSALYLHSESVKVDDAIGSTTPLETLTVVTENDDAQRGQFLRSVATVGKQAYKAQYTSGDVEFNGTYTTSDSDIELVGIGAYGVYLSLLGNTVIDVGEGSFSVQKVGASSGGQLFSNGGPYDLSITAANISVPAGMGIDDAATLPNPELGVFTIGGTAATDFDVSQVVATGGIVAAGEVRLQQAATLNSTGGAINLSGGLTLAGDTTLNAPGFEFSDGVTGNSHNLTLSPSSSSIKLDGIQLSGVNELTIGGDLELAGNLNAQDIDIQGDTTLLGDANLTATGTASGDWSTASLTNTVVTSGSAMKLTLSPDGRHAYIADDNEGMQVVDLQHPSGPAIVGNFDSAVGNALDVVANATHAFVSHWMGDLHIVDVSNPSSPQSVGNVSLPDMGLPFGGTPFGLSLHGDALYVADARAGIHHVDVSDPANPSVSETFGTGATFFGVTVAGGYTFAATSAGLKVYDGARTNVATASLSGNGDARSVVVSADGQTAFVANFNGGLDIFDISTPSNPQHLDNYSTAGLGHDVALSSDESLAFVADGPNGKLVLDVSNTSDIKFVGNHATTGSDTDGNVYDVAVASDDAATFTVTHKSENDPGKAGLDIFSLVTQGISFGGTVDGGYALSTNGTTSFVGVVGETDSLASLTTVGGGVSVGGDVTTTGNQSFGGEATIAGDTTFSGDDVSISGLEGGGFNVDFSATSTTIDAGAYSVANVANLNVSGDVGLNGTIATTGNQTFGGDVGLLGNTTLTAGAGAISLGTDGGVEGASHTLTLGDANQTGDVTLGGGSEVTIGGLNIGAGNFNLAITAGASKAVTVSSPVDILSTGALTVTTASNDMDSVVTFTGGLNATAPSEVELDGIIETDSAPINLSHLKYTGDGSQPSFLWTGDASDFGTNFTGNQIEIASLDTGIGMLVYHGGETGALTVQGDAIISGNGIKGWGDLNINGNTTVSSNVSVDGDQNYAENVSLTGDVVFEGNTATFTNGVLGGGHDLTFKFAQPSKLDGLANVNNFTSSGQIELNGSFVTSGSQEFAAGVSLGGDATLHAASGFIKLNGIAGETYDLTIGNTTLPAPTADLIITSDVALNALNATTGNYDASLTGASMKLQQATFDNSGNITLGDNPTDSLVIGGGLFVQNAAVTTVAGTIASNGSQIKIRNINLTADTHIDTTNSGMVPAGAQILLDGNMQLGGFALDTKSGAVDTTLEGDITIANGSFEVLQGDLDLGESGNASNAANITILETATIKVPENGTLNVFDGSKLDAGDNPINIIANNISFQTNAGSFTSTKEITITPATSGKDIFVGDIADTKTTSDGLLINQTAYSKMQSPNLTIGGAGYDGTITVENANGTLGRLNLIANGTGGAINISDDLVLPGNDAVGVSLYIEGSGGTTDVSGEINSAGDIIIDDAVRILGASQLYSSDGNITITGGSAGIYSANGSNDLDVRAYNGSITAGNQTGFGDNSGSDSFIDNLLLWSANTTIGDGNHTISGIFQTPYDTLTILGTSSTNLSADSYSMYDVQGNSNSLTVTATTTGYGGYVGSISDVLDLTFNGNGSDASFDLRGDVTTAGFQDWNVPVLNLRDNEGTQIGPSSDDLNLTAGGDITISELNRRMGSKKAGSLLSNLNLTIDAPSGNVAIDGVSISEPSGGRTDVGLGNVTISNAANVSLGGGFSDNGTGNGIDGNFIMTGISDTVTLNATSGSSYLIGGELSIDSAHVVVDANVTLETEGNLSITATGSTGNSQSGIDVNSIAGGTTTLRALGSSNLTLNGTSGDQWSTWTEGVDLGDTAGGNVLIETASGDITIVGVAAGNADEGIVVEATTIQTTAGGAITLNGTAGNGNPSNTTDPLNTDNDGISFEGNAIVHAQAGGDISITGVATNEGEGIDLDDETPTSITTSTGDVFLNGTNTGSDDGVQVGGNTLFTVGGNLTIDGTGGGDGTYNGSGAGVKFKNSTANVSGNIWFTGNSVDDYGTELVSSQLTAIAGGMTFTGNLTGNATDGNNSRAGFLSEGSSINASQDITVSYDLNHPSATAIRLEESDSGTASTMNSAIGSITLNGTAEGMDHAVYIGEQTELEAYENLTITGVYNGNPGQGQKFYYGVAVFDDVTLTAQNQALVIGGSTTQESGGGYGVGFDDNNTLTGNTSVTIKADSQDWSYGDNISVQGNGSLEIISESDDFSQNINLANVTFGTSFTSAKIGVLTATGRSVQIGTQGLSVNGPIEIYGGTPIIDGELASTAEGQSVLISGASGIEVGKNISTTNGALTLQGTTTATDSIVLSSGSGVLDLTGKIVGEPAGQHKVTINTTGTATIVGADNLSEFVFNGGTIGLQGNITTTDSQTYDGTVQLDGDTILQGFGLDIDGVVGNGKNFGLDFQEVAVLDGNFTNINDFTSGGDVSLNGNFVTLGSQTYNANVSLGGDAELAGTTLSLASGIDGAGHDLVLGFQEQTTIDGNFINIKDLKSSYSVALEGGITTSGYQEYNASAVLVGNTTLQGTDLTFSNGLDGTDKSLDLNFSNTTFLNDNFVNIRDLTSEGDVSLSGTITTSGSQDYKAAANLSDNTTLEGDSLVLASGVDGNSKNLDLNFSQATSLDGSFTNINNLTSEGDVLLNGNLTTLGDQTYQAAASLAGNVILQGESLLFSSGVSGAFHSLGLDFSKSTALNGTFENIDFLTSGGDVSLNGTIRTIESQTYNANVSLSGNTTLEGSVLSVASGVDGGGKNLDLNFSSTTSLSGGFSNIGNLASEGNVAVNGTIQTLGSQTYNASVNLTGTVNLQGTSGNFGGAVNGNDHDLTLNFSAPTTIDGGSVFSGLANLTVTGASNLDASIETSGVQTYEGPVTLLGATALKGKAGVFSTGVQGDSNGLVLNFTDTVVIDGESVFSNLGNLTVVNNASLSGSIQTSGFQYYNGGTTLLGDTTIKTGTSGDVNFGSVDGVHDLSIESGSGRVNFFGALGSSVPLQSLNLDSASAVEAFASLTIDGTGGSGPGLRIGSTVGSVNMTAAGSSISTAYEDGILFAGSSTDSTLANFTITNSGDNGINMAGGDYTNTTIRDSFVTTSGGHGLYANNATGFTVTDSLMTLNEGSGVYVEGLASEGVTVSHSTFGIGSGGNVAAGNKGYGVGFAGGKNHVADNNTIGGNDLTGLLAVSPVTGETVSNITFTNNWVGLTRSEEPVPNGQAGIWVLGDVTNSEGYTQGFVDDVKIQGNRVENAIFNGIEIDNATKVIVGGFEAGKHNQINFSQQYGLAMTGGLTGTDVRGNTLNGNIDTGLYLNDVKGATIGGLSGALEIYSSNFGVTAIGDLTGTQMTANHIHSNNNAGAFLMKAKNFDLFRNKIEDNGPYGVLAFDESTGTTLVGNTIEKSEAGIWLSGASGLTIGYDENGTASARRKPNKITDNYNVGIIVQGSTAADNTILSNEIYLNKYYGIRFVGGAAPSVRPPRLFAASLHGDTTTVAGRLNGNPGDKYMIQYFQTKPEDVQPGSAPEGQVFLHSQTVEIPSEGFFILSTEIVKDGEYAISAGDWITTTATAMKDNVPDQTSVFSSGVRVREVQ